MYGPFELPEGTTWDDLRTPSVASLVLANLIPLAGTLFFGWSSGVILVLYWFKTAVIGFYSILKLPFAQRWYALLTVPFFIVHFGAFIGITGFVALGSYLVIDGVEGEQPETWSSHSRGARPLTPLSRARCYSLLRPPPGSTRVAVRAGT